ncbi:murein hydrolase activator EnvC family protein [Dyella caseinilytica]|uniref:Peptidoglycan DD-metalloendopeptidase family protein n=1 Tax=Dyella caseinilytica TaxID=1849581 RepID=A0ABX7GUW7_9GAMM|nr:peptidoglycan DD-metalloendopeptidase family protein [Dyella caseinilytica]QRN54089.1 peptidoglycan DD-metalloendopeptidase family protein [Dyella caseinilytica]GFZ91515.1 peptidase M23 [Dyella caseinilytica]
MPTHSRTFRPLLAPLIACAVTLSANVFTPVQAAQDNKAETQQAEAKQQLTDLQAKMQALTKEQADTAARRDSANATLAKQSDAVASAAKAVRDTDTQIAAKQQELDQLQTQRNTLSQSLDSQRAAIADLLRATYAIGQGSDMRLLLGDEDIARIARSLAYSKYFQQDRVQKVQDLMTQLTKLQDLETQITAEQQALQATRAQRAQQASTLEQQRKSQQQMASQIDAQYKNQAQKLAAMKQNEQSLDDLLVKLQKAIDEAAREAERRARANPTVPSGGPSKALANIRGNLPWPAVGPVHTFGNGVLIASPRGSEVHAVASGRVVYAHFMRGYGQLIILSHGNGWLSMYGNNETLLHGVGDDVAAGEALGTAMLSTSDSNGVYFELRHNGQPVDPRSWLSQRR